MARIRLGQVVSESAPPSGQISVYAKTDENLYIQTPGGDEFQILTDHTPGVGGYNTEQHIIDLTQFAAKEIELSDTPIYPTRTLFFIDGAGPTFYGLDFTVSGNVLTWNSLRLDGLIGLDDRVQIVYF
jgi:hypothetical protein